MSNRQKIYEKRVNRYTRLIEKQNRVINLVSYLRLAAFIIGFGTAVYLYYLRHIFIGTGSFLLAVCVFGYIILIHNKMIENRKFASYMREINENAVKRVSGKWKEFYDNGDVYVDEEHSYTGDLDIFGQGSLFQWLNTAATFLGRKKVVEALSSPCRSREVLHDRQKSSEELAGKLTWRQRLVAEGLRSSEKLENPEELIKWGKTKIDFYNNPWAIVFFRFLPVPVIALLTLSFTYEPFFQIRSLVILSIILFQVPGYKERAKTLKLIYKYKNTIKAFRGMIQWVEKGRFSYHHLNELQSRFIIDKRTTATKQIQRLSKISDRVSDRGNAFYVILNFLLLLDYQIMFSLERWKREAGTSIESWLDTIAEMELLCSLALIRYDHPDWAVPEFIESKGTFYAKQAGHPLLSESRTYNDIDFRKPVQVLLITGSNMSGKSTFLRTAGINLVLAYAGAAVCAKTFVCSIMDIYTCMRISDNMEKNISSFYAEIIRVKKIVNAVKEGKEVFFLLDEIFKGTNSVDRHMGARVLIKQLLEEGAMGMVSTHDLELGDMERKNEGRIKNYHFREFFKNDKLYFDYKLRQGISTTRNAMYLIKMAGIEIEGVED